MTNFSLKRAMLRSPDLFKRFRIKGKPTPLAKLNLPANFELIVFERQGRRYGLKLNQMGYHHAAQGTMDGEPFLIAFCGVCHSGMGFIPIIDGKVHHFSVGGLHDGIAILIDDESRTYWNHISGKALHGPLVGKQLDTFNVQVTTVEAELGRSQSAAIWVSKPNFKARLFLLLQGRKNIKSRGFIPPFFYRSLAPPDRRFPRLTQGLGVIINDKASFYARHLIPEGGLTDSIDGVNIKVDIRPEDFVPFAIAEDGSYPMQIFTRWYGFVSTWPHTAAYGV